MQQSLASQQTEKNTAHDVDGQIAKAIEDAKKEAARNNLEAAKAKAKQIKTTLQGISTQSDEAKQHISNAVSACDACIGASDVDGDHGFLAHIAHAETHLEHANSKKHDKAKKPPHHGRHHHHPEVHSVLAPEQECHHQLH